MDKLKDKVNNLEKTIISNAEENSELFRTERKKYVRKIASMRLNYEETIKTLSNTLELKNKHIEDIEKTEDLSIAKILSLETLLESRNDIIESNNVSYKADVDNLTKEIDDVDEKFKVYKETNEEKFRVYKEAKEEECCRYQKKEEQSKQSEKEKNKQIHLLTGKNKDFASKIDDLSKELHIMKEKKSENENTISDLISKLFVANENILSEQEKLRENEECLKESEGQNKQYEVDKNQMINQNKCFQDEINRFKIILETSDKEHKHKILSLTANINKKKQDVQALKKRIKESEQCAYDQEREAQRELNSRDILNDKLTKQNNDLESELLSEQIELKRSRDDNNKYKELLEEIKTSYQEKSLELESLELSCQKKLVEADNELKSTRETHKKIMSNSQKNTKNQLKELKNNIDVLLQEKHVLTSNISIIQEGNKSLANNIVTIRTLSDNLSTEKEELNKEITSLKKDRNEVEAKFDNLQHSYQSLCLGVKQLEQTINKLTEDNNRLKILADNGNEYKTSLSNLEVDHAKINEELNNMYDSVDTLVIQNNELRSNEQKYMASFHTTLQENQNNITTLNSLVNTLQNEGAKMSKHTASVETANIEFKKYIEQLEKCKNEYEIIMDTLKDNLKDKELCIEDKDIRLSELYEVNKLLGKTMDSQRETSLIKNEELIKETQKVETITLVHKDLLTKYDNMKVKLDLLNENMNALSIKHKDVLDQNESLISTNTLLGESVKNNYDKEEIVKNMTDEVKVLKNNIKLLENSVATSEDEITFLSNKLTEQEEENKQLKFSKNTIEKELSNMIMTNKNFIDDISEKDKSIVLLTATMQTMQYKFIESEKNMETLREDLHSLQETSKASTKRAEKNCSHLTMCLKNKETEILALINDNKNLTKQEDDLKQIKNSLEQELNNVVMANEKFAAEYAINEKRLIILEKENKEYDGTVVLLESSIKALNEHKIADDIKIKEFYKKFTETDESLISLSEKYKKILESNQTVEKQAKEFRDTNSELITCLQNTENEKRRLDQFSKDIECHKNNFEKELLNVKTVNEKFASDLMNKEKIIESFTRTVKTLEDEMSKISKQNKELEMVKDTVEKDLINVTSINEKFAGDLLDKDRSIMLLTNSIQILERELTDINKERSEKTKIADELESLKKGYSSILTTQMQEKKRLTANIDELEMSRRNLLLSIKSNETVMESKEKYIKSTEDQLSQHQLTVDKLRDEITKNNEQYFQSKNMSDLQLHQKQVELQQLNMQLAETKHQLKMLQG